MSESVVVDNSIFDSYIKDVSSSLDGQKEIYHQLMNSQVISDISDDFSTFQVFFDKIGNFVNTIQDISKDLKKKTEKIQKLKAKKEKYKLKNIVLSQEIAIKKSENEKLQTEFKMLSNEYLILLNKFQVLQDNFQNKILEENEEKTKNQIIRNETQNFMKLQFENEQLQETLENIENEKAALERELSKLKKMIKEKYIPNEKVAQEELCYQQKIDELQNKLTHSNKVMSQLEKDIDSYKSANNDLSKQIETYKYEMSTLNTNSNTCDFQNDELDNFQCKSPDKCELNNIDLGPCTSHFFCLSNLDNSFSSYNNDVCYRNDIDLCKIQITPKEIVNTMGCIKKKKGDDNNANLNQVISISSFSILPIKKTNYLPIIQPYYLNNLSLPLINVSKYYLLFL